MNTLPGFTAPELGMKPASRSWTDLEGIGNRIKAIRLALDMNQTEFARRAGIALNTYNQYESGKSRPQLDIAIKICTTYGVTLDWIYLGDPSGLPHRTASQIVDRAS